MWLESGGVSALLVAIELFQWQYFLAVIVVLSVDSMVRVTNVGGGLGDDDRDRRPPSSSGRDKGKAVQVERPKKCKRLDRATREAIAAAADRAERGGRAGGLHIGDVHVSLSGRETATKETEGEQAQSQDSTPQSVAETVQQ